MTSLAKIAANRRNALKSTGPKTVRGKTRSSRNAFKHGMTAKPSATEVLNRFRIFVEDPSADPDAATTSRKASRAMRLAHASLQLEHVQRREVELLAEYDRFYRQTVPDHVLVENLMDPTVSEWKLTRSQAYLVLRTTGFGIEGGRHRAKHEFQLMRRYISEAERAQIKALDNFCEIETQNSETKPRSEVAKPETKPK